MADKDWNTRYRDARVGVDPPARVLWENAHLLPRHGMALDLACGLGANALALARRGGLYVRAWDSSATAITALARYAVGRSLPLSAEVRDVVDRPPAPDTFDVIVVSRFLDRSLLPHLPAALRPGGLLFYQTFTRTRVDDSGPRNPDFRLKDGELLATFAALTPVVYREERTLGDPARGLRNEALYVGWKPAAAGEGAA